MIDRERLRALLIERAKEAGVFSDTPAFMRHIDEELADYLTDEVTDHETELSAQIIAIREVNVRAGRIPYEGYPYA